MKARIAKGSLVVSVVLLVMGFYVSCYCPGWYALAWYALPAGFAGLAALLGKSSTRYWGIACLVVSLAFTAINWELRLREAERFRELHRRLEEINHRSGASRRRSQPTTDFGKIVARFHGRSRTESRGSL